MSTHAQRFDGATFEPSRDAERLTSQLEHVLNLMRDGRWRSLRQIAQSVQGSEASVSARLRDLRKPRFGGFTVERKYEGNGLYVYRVLAPRPMVQEVLFQ